MATVRKRSGGAYHPRMAERFCDAGADAAGRAWTRSRPGSRCWRSSRARDSLLTDDAVRPRLRGDGRLRRHQIALHAGPFDRAWPRWRPARAGAAGWSEADVTALRRAGLLHDIGRVGVSAGIWGKPGALSEREWEQVRLHPYYTERVLARPEPLAPPGRAGRRSITSGWTAPATTAPRRPALSPAARILAAADAYQAMTEPRPHRPALSPDAGRRRAAPRGARRPAGRRCRPRRAGRGRAPRPARPPRAAGRPQRARGRGAAAARARPLATARWPSSSTISQRHGQAPHPAHLRQDRRLHPRRRDAVRDGKRPPLRSEMARTGDGGACGSAHAVSVAGTTRRTSATSEEDPPMTEERQRGNVPPLVRRGLQPGQRRPGRRAVLTRLRHPRGGAATSRPPWRD